MDRRDPPAAAVRDATPVGATHSTAGMHFPAGWDPYFNDYMTLRDVYHYPTQHYDHHRAQLTITAATGTKQTR